MLNTESSQIILVINVRFSWQVIVLQLRDLANYIHKIRIRINTRIYFLFQCDTTYFQSSDFFAYPRDQRAVTRLENVRHLNIRRGKKGGFQLSHTQPLRISICFQFENFNRLISKKQFVSIYQFAYNCVIFQGAHSLKTPKKFKKINKNLQEKYKPDICQLQIRD